MKDFARAGLDVNSLLVQSAPATSSAPASSKGDFRGGRAAVPSEPCRTTQGEWSLPPVAGLEPGLHETTSGRRNARLVFARDVQTVEPVQQMGARAQDHGARPFHKLTNFGKPGFGETSAAQFLGQSGGAPLPQELGPRKLAAVYSLANGFKRNLVHGGYLYIASAVCWDWNMPLKYEYCCSMEAISASAEAIWFCIVSCIASTAACFAEIVVPRLVIWDFVSVSSVLSSPVVGSSTLVSASVAVFRNPPPVAEPRNEVTLVELARSAAMRVKLLYVIWPSVPRSKPRADRPLIWPLDE